MHVNGVLDNYCSVMFINDFIKFELARGAKIHSPTSYNRRKVLVIIALLVGICMRLAQNCIVEVNFV